MDYKIADFDGTYVHISPVSTRQKQFLLDWSAKKYLQLGNYHETLISFKIIF